MGPIGAVLNDETGRLRHDTAHVILATAMIAGSHDPHQQSLGVCMKAPDARLFLY